jgi:GAF domain-containing protein
MPDADDLTESVGQVRAAVLAELRERASSDQPLRLVCQACVRLLPVDGASVSMMTATAERTVLYASDEVVARIEALQFSLGEGPCVEAFETRRPVLVPDLPAALAQSWPVFAEEMIDQPVSAIFALPLRSDAISLGAMDLYRRRTGRLSPRELAIALALADVAAMALLAVRIGESPMGGTGARQWGLYGDRGLVHQASGVVMAALDLTSEQALSRLRGYAFASGRMVDDVAREIVARVLSPTELDR